MIYTVILFFAAGVFEAIMDYLQFYYTDQNYFWNPRLSWMNKWKMEFNKGLPSIKTGVEKFPFSSTILVFLTDGWHLMKWCRNRCIDASLFILLSHFMSWYYALLMTIILRSAYGAAFEILFRNLKS